MEPEVTAPETEVGPENTGEVFSLDGSSGGGGDLRRGFAAFVAASRRLEESYATLKKRAASVDRQLAESNRELEQTLLEREMVFSALPVGLLSLSPEPTSRDRIRWCNPEGERLRTMIEDAGRNPCDLKDGSADLPGVSLRVRRIDLLDGGTLLMIEDRSRVRLLEQEVDRLDRMAGLSELALGIAHEIKNPLNGVMGFAALMDRTANADKQKHYARKISLGLDQVDAIVKALLAFARPSENVNQPAPVARIVADSASAAGVPLTRIDRSALEAVADLEVDAPVLVRVLSNLFRNAAEAADQNVQLEIAGTRSGSRLVLEVSDDGPGVPADVAERIFKPFFTTKDRGHGLGLALACRVLSFLEGSLELVNRGVPGARFRVTMPLCSVAKEAGAHA